MCKEVRNYELVKRKIQIMIFFYIYHYIMMIDTRSTRSRGCEHWLILLQKLVWRVFFLIFGQTFSGKWQKRKLHLWKRETWRSKDGAHHTRKWMIGCLFRIHEDLKSTRDDYCTVDTSVNHHLFNCGLWRHMIKVVLNT